MASRSGLLLPMALCGLACAAAAPTLETLLQRNLEARGGAAALASVRTLTLTGEIRFPGGFKIAYRQQAARPNRVREEATLQGLTQVQVFDQGTAWQINPFQGRKDPERMSADDAKGLALDADLDGPLVGWREEGTRVEYLGTEDVDGTQAHKLKATLANGTIRYVFLDPDAFLEIRILTQTRIRGSLQETETDLGEYAQVAGVWWPMSLESGAPGGPRTQFLNFAKAEVNLPVADAQFRFPGGVAQ